MRGLMDLCNVWAPKWHAQAYVTVLKCFPQMRNFISLGRIVSVAMPVSAIAARSDASSDSPYDMRVFQYEVSSFLLWRAWCWKQILPYSLMMTNDADYHFITNHTSSIVGASDAPDVAKVPPWCFGGYWPVMIIHVRYTRCHRCRWVLITPKEASM